MIQWCYVCNQKYGEKEPLKDKSVTSGICLACWPTELIKLYNRLFGRALQVWTEDHPPKR